MPLSISYPLGPHTPSPNHPPPPTSIFTTPSQLVPRMLSFLIITANECTQSFHYKTRYDKGLKKGSPCLPQHHSNNYHIYYFVTTGTQSCSFLIIHYCERMFIILKMVSLINILWQWAEKDPYTFLITISTTPSPLVATAALFLSSIDTNWHWNSIIL